MRQPDLGLKVAELRQQKGMTQEQLAEKCEVSPRTIQRIESSEVDPRAYTLNCLSAALDFDFSADDTANENLWLALLHLSSAIPLLIVPLLVWSWKKTHSYKIDRQGLLVLNFQITMVLLLFIAGCILMSVPAVFFVVEDIGLGDGNLENWLVLLPPLPLVLISIFCTYQGVVNAMRAIADKPVRYPLSIPFVK
jgi:uncharacterized Tic20 family protein/DNA-binding Xre family transcriptional regulator